MTDEKQEKKRKSYKAVNMISSRGKNAVVEWVYQGRAHRKIVPTKAVSGGKIETHILDQCPDYGIPWSSEIHPTLTAEEIEIALHNAGIWTPEDVWQNPNAIIGALNAAYKTDLAMILQIANKYKNKE